MAFMDWAIEVATAHPELSGAFINADGEWLDILLPDGRTFRFRPGQMIDEAKPEAERKALLVRLISIGVAGAEPAAREETAPEASSPEAATSASSPTEAEADGAQDSPDEDEGILRKLMPIVRSADFFVVSHDHSRDDSIIYVPMTPFIGTGIAIDGPNTITPMYFSDTEKLGLPADIGPLFESAVMRLRLWGKSREQTSVQVHHREIDGCQIFEFDGPGNYESSWFMDVDTALFLNETLGKVYDSLPLFVPASRTSMFIVMADDPGLAGLFRTLAGRVGPDIIYPLPHVVSQDGWSEWIPMPDHPAARILSKMRTSSRERIYGAQVRAMERWPGDFGVLADFEAIRSGDLTASCTRWGSTDGYGSLPDTDYIAFVRERPREPWSPDRGEIVLLRSQVARDVWHEGISPMDNVWPPRWSVQGFPDEAQFNALKEASGREF
ncbi:MAG: hypothetical protein Q3979_03325 [Actinomycetaceae bacterium]|nr:hypothetical protein [Actinomycetaceae bacterium]